MTTLPEHTMFLLVKLDHVAARLSKYENDLPPAGEIDELIGILKVVSSCIEHNDTQAASDAEIAAERIRTLEESLKRAHERLSAQTDKIESLYSLHPDADATPASILKRLREIQLNLDELARGLHRQMAALATEINYYWANRATNESLLRGLGNVESAIDEAQIMLTGMREAFTANSDTKIAGME